MAGLVISGKRNMVRETRAGVPGEGEIFFVKMFCILVFNNKIIDNRKPVVCDERIIGIPHQTANILTMKG